MNIPNIEMLLFANFVQNINFERPQFQRVGMALTEFNLFESSLL